MKLIFNLFFISFTMLFACKQVPSNTEDVLAATEFAQAINKTNNAIILDVRTPEEFSKGHLPKAVNIDWNNDMFEKQIANISYQTPVFIYCLSGARSSAAAEMMRLKGYSKVIELDGGILKWRGKGLPEENNGTSPSLAFEKFQTMVSKEKTVLVDFYADWCGPCKVMKPDIDAIAAEMNNEVEVIRINADDNQSLLEKLGVDALPTLHIYQKGKLHWSNTGLTDKKNIVSHLKQ